MEFIKTEKYIEGNFNRPIDYDRIKKMEKVEVNQKLEILPGRENLARLKKYAKMGLKIISIRRVSSRDWSQRKDFPNRVLVETTSYCNMTCRMCPRRDLRRSSSHLDKKMFFKVIDELDKYGVEGVWLFRLGEPVLHPDWKKLVNYATSKKNIEMVWFSTNGVAFNEDAIEFILKSKVNFLNYSLHGTNEETFGFVSPKQFYKVVRGHLDFLLKRKKELGKGPIINIKMIDQEGTHQNVNEFLEAFYQTGEMVSISNLEYADLPNNQYGLRQRKRLPMKKCSRLSKGDCTIISTGDVHPCEDAYNGELLMGNVGSNTLYEIWNSTVRKYLLDLNKRGKIHDLERCRECTDYDF